MANANEIGERRGLLAQMRRRITLARAVLAAERVWRAVWPAAAALGAYIAAGLFGVFGVLSEGLHLAALIALAGFAAIVLARGLRGLSWPSEAEARRRLERDGGAAHRPLDAIIDTPATAAGGAALWRRHGERMAETARRLRPRPPRLALTREDPRAVRALVLLVLAVGLLYAGSDGDRRIRHAFSPSVAAAPETVTLDAWITPPEYTGKRPVVLHSADSGKVRSLRPDEPVAVPEGSTVTALLHGGEDAPVLLRANGGATQFERKAPREHRVETAINGANRLEIRQSGRLRARWPLAIEPDEPPTIAFGETPSESRRHALRIDYTLRDDYGVDSARLRIVPVDLDGEALVVELAGAETRGESVSRRSYEDLTAHRYAGAKVRARLTAVDAAGQKARSAAKTFRLPERDFEHPVAQELADIRLSLLREPTAIDAPASRIDRLSQKPGRFDHDLTVFTAMRSAYWRLSSDRSGEGVEETARLLWQTALRLEDGQLTMATRELREALDSFAEAMEGDSRSLKEAAKALERKLQKFLSQMAAQQSKMAPTRGQASSNGESQVVQAEGLQRMIERMRELAAAGETEAARRMLRQLRDVAENARAGGVSAQAYERMMAASRAAGKLQKLERKQRELLNQTGRQTLVNRLRQRRGEPDRSFRTLQNQQAELQSSLSALLGDLADSGMQAPGKLESAGKSMNRAAKALSQESGPGAVRRQAEAVAAMNDANRKMQKSLEQARAAMPASSALDPLGRMRPGLSGRDFEIPEELSAKEVERILKELRRRLSDPDLSQEERDYLRRLLERF